MNINKIRMDKDLNGKWCMEVYADGTPSIIKTEIAYDGGNHYHYGEDENGFVSFGVSFDEKVMGHEAGYMWSSRCGVFNTAFNKRIIDITLCTPNSYGNITRWGCYYMTVDKAMELMPNDFHISLFDAYDEEVFLFIKDGEPDEYWGYDYICPIFQR